MIPFLLVCGVSLLVLAGYLVPALNYLRDFPRPAPLAFENPLKLVTYLFFPGALLPPGGFLTWEYQIFIGPLLFVFFAVALKQIREVPVAFRALLLCAGVHTLLALGSLRALGSPIPSPFDLLREAVPGFSNVRVTSRFLIGALPGIMVLAFWEWRRRSIGRVSIFLVLAPLVGFQLHNTFSLGFNEVWLAPKKGPPLVDTRFQWVLAPEHQMFSALGTDSGVANGYESTPLPSQVGLGFSGPALRDLPEGIQAQWIHWGRLRFTSAGKITAPAFFHLQVNPHRFWKIESRQALTPRLIASALEPLGIEIGAGKVDFDLVFTDPSAVVGRRISVWAFFAGVFVLGGWHIVRRLAEAKPPKGAKSGGGGIELSKLPADGRFRFRITREQHLRQNTDEEKCHCINVLTSGVNRARQ
jgi:hypothetical protein